MGDLLLPGNAPFVVAIGLMVVIGALESLSLLLGLSLTEHAGSLLVTHFGLDHGEAGAEPGAVGQFLGWLHIGRIPLLMVLILFLLGFAVVGLSLQQVLRVVTGWMAPPAFAAVLACAGALPFVRQMGGLICRYLPQNESTAVSEEAFIGRTAQIVTGTASEGVPAEARLVDEFGQPHYVRVEPDEPDQSFARGTTVLLVSRVSGSHYRVIANPHPDLL